MQRKSLVRRSRGLGELLVTMRLLRKNTLGFAGIFILVCMFIVAISAPWIAPYDPLSQNLLERLQQPSTSHLFGTDPMGRDVFSRVIWGARISPMAGVFTIAVTAIIGFLVGTFSGYIGGMFDTIVMRITDIFLAFPALILAMGMAAALGPSLLNAMIAIAVAWWPEYARIARGSTLSVREEEYIEAARAVGESRLTTIVNHVMPNILAPVLVKFTLDIGVAILFTAALSFIGLGAQPPTPEWGAMVTTGREYLSRWWWIATFPGIAILVAVMGFNLLGDGLRDVLDPKLRR